jgi:hypothetical protein
MLAALSALLVSVFIVYPTAERLPSRTVITILSAILGVVSGLYVLLLLRFLRVNPATLTISLLGLPNSGKTVYLTVLFRELMTSGIQGIKFSPYGSETVERVTRGLNTLLRGKWLPPTSPNEVFFYRAVASVGGGVLARRYKIEIGDYAGQRMKEFNTEDEMWLHKTDYFKYILQSDAVLLSVDSAVVQQGNTAEIRAMENSFMAAIQLLIEGKGVEPGRRLHAPVALVFMKADLVPSDTWGQLPNKFSGLISFCRGWCEKFETFVVSSVGRVDEGGLPLPKIEPKGVMEPMLWILRSM